MVKVAVLPETDSPMMEVDMTGKANSTTTVAPVDGHGTDGSPCDARMLSNAAEK